MSNNTGFMNFPTETAAAFPSQTALPSTVQSPLDPLSVNDPWASAVAVRPVQQQHQMQVPFWPQLQGTEFWPQTGQSQQWPTPRSPLGLTGPPLLDLVVVTAVDRMPRGLVGMRAEKGYKGNGMPFMEISDRDPIPKWDFQESGARLRPWLRELSFGRHDTSTPVHKQGVKLYKHCPSERLVGAWRINSRRIRSARVKGLI